MASDRSRIENDVAARSFYGEFDEEDLITLDATDEELQRLPTISEMDRRDMEYIRAHRRG